MSSDLLSTLLVFALLWIIPSPGLSKIMISSHQLRIEEDQQNEDHFGPKIRTNVSNFKHLNTCAEGYGGHSACPSSWGKTQSNLSLLMFTLSSMIHESGKEQWAI